MRSLLIFLLVVVVSPGCFGPAYDPSKRPTVGPGATSGVCDDLLEGMSNPVALVRLAAYGNGEQVMVELDGARLRAYDVNENGCAAIGFEGEGEYRFFGWHSCTQEADVKWDGTSNLEIFIPYDRNACV